MAIAYSHSTTDPKRRIETGDGQHTPLFGGKSAQAHPVAQPPLLARIPDVSSAAKPAPPLANAAGHSHEIRFDPPQPHHERDQYHGAVERTPRPARNEDFGARLREGDRPAKGDEIWRSRPTRTSALPAGNPFAIPTDRLQDRLAPAMQFLLLFVLFTAAGTSLLMIGGVSANRAPVDATATSADATTAVPTATAQSPDDQQPFESPTAPTSLGPTGGVTGMRPAPPSWQSLSTGPNWNTTPSPEVVPSIARTEAITDSAISNADSAAEFERSPLSKPSAAEQPATPYPTTDFAPTMLLDLGDVPPPQVRTHDPTPAVARLRGDIGNVSPR